MAAPPPPRVEPPPRRSLRLPDDRDAVLATLGRYRAAYESLDADAVARVFTGVDVRELRRAFRQSKSMRVQIDIGGCQTSVDGDRATATCNVTRVIDPKAGGSQTPQPARDLPPAADAADLGGRTGPLARAGPASTGSHQKL